MKNSQDPLNLPDPLGLDLGPIFPNPKGLDLHPSSKK